MHASHSLDLRKNLVNDYWMRKNPRMARMLVWMETVEDWGLDEHEDVAPALRDLAFQLERTKGPLTGDMAQKWLEVLAYMSSTKAMRLVEFLDHHQHNRKGALDLVQTAHSCTHHDYAKVFLDRLQALRTLDMLSKIFSPKRIDAVTMLLRRAKAQNE